jgi:isoquinoline 1-oxidoreductase alpha subunit
MCGYCEPGFIMAIAALLQATPSPSDEQIAEIPNLCRCGAYPRIRKAIRRAAQAGMATDKAEHTDPKRFSGGSYPEEQKSPQDT